jgi:ABC-type transporter Mla subunit MlaD
MILDTNHLLDLAGIPLVGAALYLDLRRRRTSVASITAGLQRTVDKLDRHAARKDAAVAKHVSLIERLHLRRAAAATEATQAKVVSANIAGLLGAEKVS